MMALLGCKFLTLALVTDFETVSLLAVLVDSHFLVIINASRTILA